MSYQCKILLDSISETGKRITTFEITFPRIVLAELNTHRMFSRNSASSRAIPFKKQLERVGLYPFIPEAFPLNQKGMQPQEYVTPQNDPKVYDYLRTLWLNMRNQAMTKAECLYNGIGDIAPFSDLNEKYLENEKYKNVHKQIVNRLLEPFMWHTVIITATEFDNFFKLRCNENAQYEIKRIADLMYEAYHLNFEYYDKNAWGGNLTEWQAKHSPIQKLKVGEWHRPLVYQEDNTLIEQYIISESKFQDYTARFLEIKKQISVARTARVSYLTHDGKRDIEKDLELFERLRTSGHWSPFEHVATPYFKDSIRQDEITDNDAANLWSGNFWGWRQYRKEFQDENCIDFRKES